MLAEEDHNRRHNVREGDLEVLDKPAEILKIELRHDHELETRVETLVDETGEACAMSV